MDLTSILPQLQKLPEVLGRATPAQKAELLEHMEALLRDENGWPRVYYNRDTLKVYKPHHKAERDAVFSDTPRYTLFKGGEGGGKSVAGIIKDLNRIKRGMSGILLSPTLTHFQVSLWPEFQRWCPWDMVIDGHQRMSKREWIPLRPFSVVFKNNTTLYCAGIKDPGNIEGPNLSFAHFDEARHFPTALALKTLDGRVRIPGPNGEPPQTFLTTTPRMNWLFDYFGPIKEPIDEEQYESFKRNSLVVTLLTKDNEINLEEDFRAKRAQTLTPAEIAVLLDAEWGDIEAGQPFLPNMLWWDACREDLPQLTWREPMVIALDAATGRQLTASDCFALLGVTRHPDPTRADTDIAVRFKRTWRARPGQKIDFIGDEDNPGPELVLRDLCERFHVICVVYDPTELHATALRMQREGVAWFEAFTQSSKRWESDRQLLNLIQHKRIAHDGDAELRTHIARADRKLDASGKRLRIVKRIESQPIDLAVALSMAAWQVLYLNV